MRRIGVIGGGLAGLSVAYRRSISGDDVVIMEAAARLGGQLHTELADGFVVEHGAEGFVARSEAVPALAGAVGVAHHLVDQLVMKSYRLDGGSLVELAPGEAAELLGFQVARDELGRGLRSFLLGMEELVLALAGEATARAVVRPSTSVRAIEASGRRWRVCTDDAANDLEVDAVVVATSAARAASLLAPAFGDVATALGLAHTLSSVTVSLAYPRSALGHPLDGTGFIVPEAEQLGGWRACTFASSKLPGRAPAGAALLRLFFRPTPEELTTLSDAEWTRRAERALARAMRVAGPPQCAWVSRWPHALPVFDDAHRERVRALEAALSGRNVALAGAAFHGSGIDAAVRSADAAASALGAQ